MSRGHDHETVLVNQALRIGVTFGRERVLKEGFYEDLKKLIL